MKTIFSMIILVVICGATSACESDPGIRVLSSVANPENGKHDLPDLTAQVIEEDYGATIANITTVRLVSAGKPFAQGDCVFSYYRGRPNITIYWKDGDHLVIQCPNCTEDRNITLKEVKHNHILILYSNEARHA